MYEGKNMRERERGRKIMKERDIEGEKDKERERVIKEDIKKREREKEREKSVRERNTNNAMRVALVRYESLYDNMSHPLSHCFSLMLE